MNHDNLQQIFSNYIDKFELINNKDNEEYYKWRIAKTFREEMDEALNLSPKEFADKLGGIKTTTENLIDSYTQPFYGLAKFAIGEEPNKYEDAPIVQDMFRQLFADDGGDLKVRQEKISRFLKKSHELRDKHFPGSYLYNDDMHSVTGYLFLYDPENNYLFKASHAQKFADCIGFYDDWGSGENVKLDVYYKMCDQVAAEIKKCDALMAADASRFSNGWGVDPQTLHPDVNKHILVFDLIYCCSTYNLFDGINFTKIKLKEKQLVQEKKEKVQTLFKQLQAAADRMARLDEAKAYIHSVFKEGVTVQHTKYGDGTIVSCEGSNIRVSFPDAGEKKLAVYASAANNILSVDSEGYKEQITKYREYLLKESSIQSGLSYAEKEFAAYSEFLE